MDVFVVQAGQVVEHFSNRFFFTFAARIIQVKPFSILAIGEQGFAFTQSDGNQFDFTFFSQICSDLADVLKGFSMAVFIKADFLPANFVILARFTVIDSLSQPWKYVPFPLGIFD